MNQHTDNMKENNLGGHNPADLLKQGLHPDTVVNDVEMSFSLPSLNELAAIFPEYEIIELIGQGGMGAVYKIRQRELDRIAALKIMPSEIADNPTFAEQFGREAKALAKLNNPHIVTLYEYGCRQSLYYIVMEYVGGTNLRMLMENGRVAPREALSIVTQICDALQYAHDRGVVHRDIKPENILVDWEGKVKVADFGLVKLLSSSSPIHTDFAGISPGNEEGTLISGDGKVMGTPSYMAPEQLENPTVVDHRADIYALGVVFYQMLTGELPGQPVKTAPSHKVSIDVKLDEVVLKALEREPGRRYQQAGIMKTRVEEAEQRSKESKKEHSRIYRVAIGTLVVIGVLLGITAIIGGINFFMYLTKAKGYQMEHERTMSTLALAQPDHSELEGKRSKAQDIKPDAETPNNKIQVALPEDATHWLELIDEGRYADAYDQSANLVKAIVPKGEWIYLMNNFVKPLGKVLERKLYSSSISNSAPGAPDGEYLILEFETKFENKINTRETVTFIKNDEGKWTCAGYLIN